jgi:hypothetical protein
MQRYLAGAILGGILVWIWRNDIERYVDKNGRRVRSKAASTLETVQETAEGMIDRAESILERAKETVSTNLESSREAILPKKS